MLTRPSLARSIPFWVLFAGSLVALALGVVLGVGRIAAMRTAMTSGDQQAAVEVYTGQSWVVFAAAFVIAGLIGLIACLVLGVLVRFVPAAPADASPVAVDQVFDMPTVDPATAPAAPATAFVVPAAPVVPEAPGAEPAAPAPESPAN